MKVMSVEAVVIIMDLIKMIYIKKILNIAKRE